MISHRTRHSLAQLLELQAPQMVVVLLAKHGGHASFPNDQFLTGVLHWLKSADERTVMQVLSEIMSTSGDLRSRINPKYRFDQRMDDLRRCLLLDGYDVVEDRLIQTDPTIGGVVPIEDDLIRELEHCGAPRAREVIERINASADAFRAVPPDYNTALANARVSLETLAADIARDIPNPQGTFDPNRWGEIIAFLRKNGEIAEEEERGLAGVYRFLSPGAHRPIHIAEDQMTRLGRSFALNMCWFLLKNHLARRAQRG